MSRPLLLDLYCGGGGAGYGYSLAGFDVVGIDIAPQKRYPFPIYVGDALEALEDLIHGDSLLFSNGNWYGLADFAAIHASPPCQADSRTRTMPWTRAAKGEVERLIGPTRELLIVTSKPFVIENVVGAELRDPIMLCGLMFSLKLFRHRLFESNVFLMQPPHTAHGQRRIGKDGFVCVAGHGDANLPRRDPLTGIVKERVHIPADHRSVEAWRRGMGIDWMTRDELSQAIPPMYTRFIGTQLREVIG